MGGILAIPDLHLPYADEDCINRMLDFADGRDIELVVQMGDAIELYNFSRFSRSLSVITPADELRLARSGLEVFWGAMRRVAPNAKYVQLMGNHDMRIRRQMAMRWPEGLDVLDALDLEQLWRIDGVELLADPRIPYEYNDILFIHGDFLRSLTAGTRVKYLHKNVVFGHTHMGGTYWLPIHDGNLWELGCGNLTDVNSIPLSYAPMKTNKTIHGFGWIDQWGPRFISLDGTI